MRQKRYVAKNAAGKFGERLRTRRMFHDESMPRVLIVNEQGIFLGGGEEEKPGAQMIAEEFPHRISPDTIVDGKRAGDYPGGTYEVTEVKEK